MPELPPVLERMLALWNGEAVDPAAVYAHGCTENGGETTFNPEDVAAEVELLRSAFPDLRFSLENSFSAGTRHVLRMRATGTHTGAPFTTEIGTAKASAKPISMRGIEVFDVRDDRIVDVWLGVDWGSLYAALGARF